MQSQENDTTSFRASHSRLENADETETGAPHIATATAAIFLSF
jgi:hypothetical protein